MSFEWFLKNDRIWDFKLHIKVSCWREMSDIKLTSIRVLLMCVIIHGLLMIDGNGKGKHELDTEVVHQA